MAIFAGLGALPPGRPRDGGPRPDAPAVRDEEIAPGKYQTAHDAFAGALMNLGVILPGAVSDWIQEPLGYHSFFLWVLVSAISAVVLARFIPIRDGVVTPTSEGAAT